MSLAPGGAAQWCVGSVERLFGELYWHFGVTMPLGDVAVVMRLSYFESRIGFTDYCVDFWIYVFSCFYMHYDMLYDDFIA